MVGPDCAGLVGVPDGELVGVVAGALLGDVREGYGDELVEESVESGDEVVDAFDAESAAVIVAAVGAAVQPPGSAQGSGAAGSEHALSPPLTEETATNTRPSLSTERSGSESAEPMGLLSI